MDQATAKQQIVERIKQANNVLVTVSTNPTVDQLAACIGMTLMLNKLDKHATAIFSGQIPSTIEFLQPEETLEANTDSLQDFIISLDKNKADKLRYKVEDEVVRIFITPYKTSLNEKDLQFSQGDFNVEVVLALGVKDQTQIDAAISAHGRILHDATVVSINSGNDKLPAVGQLNWQDPAASSLSEMLVSISEAFGTGLIDNQIATAFLTGIVAETDRFSNTKTSPKVMTMAAQLMAAGANQQLIVSKLEPPTPPAAQPVATQPPKPDAPPAGTLNITHTPAAPAKLPTPAPPAPANEIHIDEHGNIVGPAEKLTPSALPNSAPAPNMPSIQPAAPQTPAPTTAPAPALPTISPSAALMPTMAPNATPTASSPPAENPGAHTLLDPASYQPSMNTPFTADTKPVWDKADDPIDPLATPATAPTGLMDHKTDVAPVKTPPVNNARGAVDNAIAAAKFDPAFAPPVRALNAQPMTSELHSQQPKTDIAPPAPPPMPPPINFGQGVVVPSTPPAANGQNSQQVKK